MSLTSRTLLASLVLLAGCGSEPPGPVASAPRPPSDAPWFVDRAAESGLDFVHVNGMSGAFYDSEIVPPGVALFDYDNDGDLDVYAVQGQMLGNAARAVTGPPLQSRLYRNDLPMAGDDTRRLRFTDVTERSGIKAGGYGMGVATGDYDNDGWVDLYLTHLGPDQLFHNNGDGTFSDVSGTAGTRDPAWSVSAAFVDIDRDGWLDLFVGNYLRYTIDTDKACTGFSGEPDYCAPNSYRPQPSRVYRNQRNGTFSDVTATALRGGEYGPALGVSTADFNSDGWIDIYVANDGQDNQLWINQRDGTLKNEALLSGVAVNADGRTEASMGVDAGDVDNDGDEDIFVANLTSEGSTLYLNGGEGIFEDRGRQAGVRLPSLEYTGFGAAWIDVDNDGWLDVLTVNGAVRTIEALARNRDPFPFHQAKQLFRNLGDGRLEDVTRHAGAALRASEVSRGAAFGDVDNDGDMDVLIGNNNGPLRLLVNQIATRNHWLGLRLLGTSGRDMVGARVEVIREGAATLWRRARADGSYASANDPRVLVGLGPSTQSPRVRVTWPGGRTEEWADVPADQWTTLQEGSGR